MRDAVLVTPLVAVAVGCHANENTLKVSGTVEIRELLLAPLAAGRVTRLLKDEGDTVHPGDTVALLEQPGLEALISQRRAQAQAAAVRTAEIVAAVADSQRAANDLRRAVPLHASGVISEQQYENLTSAAAAAAARLQAVRAAARDSAAARAALLATEAIRDQLTVVAPESGVVLTRFADPGEAISAGMPVVSIGLVRRPWVRAYVGERFIGRVTLGMPAAIQVDGLERPIPGRIVEIAPRAEFTPRAALTERERADLVFGIKVQADSQDLGGRLKAGMPATVELKLLP
ncbi:MAG TPA: efflux RND transporter periplasmic adaptor subunit [Gemmatimonadales bacterium]|nr:efflux RND transporter periplasmic adaptor subunit [Gemmatimonadales bacterium]